MDNQQQNPQIKVVQPQSARPVQQGLPYFFGVSADSVGSTGLSMHLVEIPPAGAPGARAQAHLHRGFETAIYVLAGRVQTHYGQGLRQSVINEAGSFLFIPPDVPHQPVNLSATQPALAVVARNHASEQEDVVCLLTDGTSPNETL
jgi:uncharacterized RmlC-like cupin family protein